MIVRPHPRFKKLLKKLTGKQQNQVKERLKLFSFDAFDPLLDNHLLKGKYRGHRSIDITGDIRAIYRPDGKDVAIFTHVGTHSQLYGR